jgi:hypothetical protein
VVLPIAIERSVFDREFSLKFFNIPTARRMTEAAVCLCRRFVTTCLCQVEGQVKR